MENQNTKFREIMPHIENPTDFKEKKRMTTGSEAATSMTHIKEFNNNENIFLSLTTHLLFNNKNRWRTLSRSQCPNKCSKFISVTLGNTKSHIVKYVAQHVSTDSIKQHFCLIIWLLLLLLQHVQSLEMTTASFYKMKSADKTSSAKLYSQLLYTNGHINMFDSAINNNDYDTYRPHVPRDPEEEMVSHNLFTPSAGTFHVFQPIGTDFKVSLPAEYKSQQLIEKSEMSKLLKPSPQHEIQRMTSNKKNSSNLSQTRQNHKKVKKANELKRRYEHGHEIEYQHRDKDHPTHAPIARVEKNNISKYNDFATDLKSLEDLLVDYITNFYEKGQYEPLPGLLVELQNNHSQPLASKTRSIRQIAATDAKIRMDLPRSLATGRVLFLTGLKKVLWPVFMGLQVLKSLLIAMFIPALIGSFTKLLGKGITTSSAPLFIRPLEPPQELDFRDNSLNFDDDNKFIVTNDGIKENVPYAYNQPDASQTNNEYVFDPSSNNNPRPFTPLGMNERQHQLMQDSYMSALQSIGSASFKNSGSLSSGSSGLLAPMAKRPPPAANVNTFQQFQNVPESSLLLSNYDPFYSPLLSRLDSVFAQLKINSDKEICREKLICLMYANPAKYAPYSNLVSAQLSRELNELRKPTSDNPDILRFFKYMRAAKDGQDGVDCEKTFDKCTEFKDFENPAMVSTYHDINKLVQARKLK